MDFRTASPEVRDHECEWADFQIARPDGSIVDISFCQTCDKPDYRPRNEFSLRRFDPAALFRRMAAAGLN